MSGLEEALGKLTLAEPEVHVKPPTRRTRASTKPKPEEIVAELSVKAPKPPTRRTRISTKKIIEEDPCTKLRFEGFLKRSSPIVKNPVALFIVGPVASGKTTTLKSILPKDFKYDYYNLDDYHEYLLEQHMLIKTDKDTQKKVKNMVDTATNKLYEEELEKNPTISKEYFIKTLSQEDLVKKYNSIFSKLLAVANRCIKQDIDRLLSPSLENKNIVIDTTGGTYDKIEEQKYILESRGYKPIMIALYSSLDTTKKRNEERYRTVPFGGIYSSWLNTIANLPLYETLFRDDFYLINTDPNVIKKQIYVRIKETQIKLEFNKDIKDIKQEIYDKILIHQGKRMSDTIPRSKLSISRRNIVSL